MKLSSRVSYPTPVVVILFETSIVTVYRYLIMGPIANRPDASQPKILHIGWEQELHDKDEREEGKTSSLELERWQ